MRAIPSSGVNEPLQRRHRPFAMPVIPHLVAPTLSAAPEDSAHVCPTLMATPTWAAALSASSTRTAPETKPASAASAPILVPEHVVLEQFAKFAITFPRVIAHPEHRAMLSFSVPLYNVGSKLRIYQL